MSGSKKSGTNCHGSSTVSYELDKVFDIISQNHFNSNPEQWHCDKCKTYDWLNGHILLLLKKKHFWMIRKNISIMRMIKVRMMRVDMIL